MVNNTYRVCKSDGGNNKCVRGGEQYGVALNEVVATLEVSRLMGNVL